VQRGAGCVVGVDYPARIVDHDDASKTNMGRMKAAYDRAKLPPTLQSQHSGGGGGSQGSPTKKARK